MIVVLIGKTLKGVSVTIPDEDDRASDFVGSAIRPRHRGYHPSV